MATYTTNYNLTKIALTDAPPDITVLNKNWDTVDAKLKSIETTAANVKNAQSSEAYLITTVYVSPSGLDTNDGLTEALPMKTIQAAVAKYAGLPRLWIRCRAGTYTGTERFSVAGFTSVNISSFSATESVTITFPLRFQAGVVQLDGITLDVSAYAGADHGAAVEFVGSNFYVTNTNIKGTTSINGLFARCGGAGAILGSTISGCNRAVRGENGAVISVSGVTSNSNNNIAVSASNSVIACSSISSITATTKTERTSSGVIFNAGNLVGTTTNVSALSVTTGS